MGDRQHLYTIFVGKLERKRYLGRPRCSWEENVKGKGKA
jgi:hypothetical protein